MHQVFPLPTSYLLVQSFPSVYNDKLINTKYEVCSRTGKKHEVIY